MTVFEVPADDLIFGQHRASTIESFGARWLSVPLPSFPHYRHLCGEDDLGDYLRLSWSDVPAPPRSIGNHVRRFEDMARAAKVSGSIEPITVTRRGAAWVVADGNHRASIALFLGLPIPAREMSVESFVGLAVRNPQLRYGTRPGQPYQTMWAKERRLITGRRDLSRRHELIDRDELIGSSVLDVGCNTGASSIFAHEAGGTVTGWDVEPGLVTSALRVALVLGYDVTFRSADAATLRSGDSWDVGFCFSVHEHAHVRSTLDRCRVVFLETHRPEEPPDELTRGRTVKKLGEYEDGGLRRLYRMERTSL